MRLVTVLSGPLNLTMCTECKLPRIEMNQDPPHPIGGPSAYGCGKRIPAYSVACKTSRLGCARGCFATNSIIYY
jgi:hypothetical protein